MASYDTNRIFLSGRLTQEPTWKPTIGTAGVAEITVACSRTLRARGITTRTKTIFVPCEAWGSVGQSLSERLHKGDEVFIEGTLEIDTWESNDQRHSRTQILVRSWRVGKQAKANAAKAAATEAVDAGAPAEVGG